MDAIRTAGYAKALLSAHGPRAEAEAARKLREAERSGRRTEAEDWRKIRRVIHQRRGPHQA